MYHIVDFEMWCPKCKHYGTDEVELPCNDCLAEPVNDDSRKPVEFQEKDQRKLRII